MRKIIAIDLDACIIDTVKTLVNLNNKLYPERQITYIPNHDWKLKPMIKSEEELKKLFKLFDNEHFYENVIPIPGAIEIIKKLSKKYEVIICSKHSSSRIPLTKKWIEETFPNVEVFFTKSFDKSEVYNKSWVVIDDKIEALDSCTNIKTYKFCFGDYEWNKNCTEEYIKMSDWNDIYNEIRMLAILR